MAVDKRDQFKQPKKQARGNRDPANSPPKNKGDGSLGMERMDPHDPYVPDGKRKNFIDGFGHKGD